MAGLDGLISGASTKISWIDPTGVKKFELLESFKAVEDCDIQKHTEINGFTHHPKFRYGWRGTAVFQVSSPVLDIYFSDGERDYFEGGDQIDLTVNQTVKYVDGTIVRWQFVNCVLAMTDGGDYTGTTIVKQSCEFFAKRRIPG